MAGRFPTRPASGPCDYLVGARSSLLHRLYCKGNAVLKTKAGGFQGHVWFVQRAGSEGHRSGCSCSIGVPHRRAFGDMFTERSVSVGTLFAVQDQLLFAANTSAPEHLFVV